MSRTEVFDRWKNPPSKPTPKNIPQSSSLCWQSNRSSGSSPMQADLLSSWACYTLALHRDILPTLKVADITEQGTYKTPMYADAPDIDVICVASTSLFRSNYFRTQRKFKCDSYCWRKKASKPPAMICIWSHPNSNKMQLASHEMWCI